LPHEDRAPSVKIIKFISQLINSTFLFDLPGNRICNAFPGLRICLGIPFAQWTAEEVSGKKQQWLDLPNKFPFFLIQKN